jgi:hypothetical protein
MDLNYILSAIQIPMQFICVILVVRRIQTNHTKYPQFWHFLGWAFFLMGIRRVTALLKGCYNMSILNLLDSVWIPFIISVFLLIGMIGVVKASAGYTKQIEDKEKEIHDIKKRFNL